MIGLIFTLVTHAMRLNQKYHLQYGETNPILRAKAKPIKTITPEIRELAQDMLDLLPIYDGVGLAAPQINHSLRMIAVTERKEKKDGDQKLINAEVMINPTITQRSKALKTTEEGCLSIPNVYGDVTRPKTVTVQYTDIHGKQKTKKLEGFSAVIVQHEVDHLDGILFVDKVVGPLNNGR